MDYLLIRQHIPDSKVYGVNMGSTWVLPAPDGPHVGPMKLAIRDVFQFKVCIKENALEYVVWKNAIHLVQSSMGQNRPPIATAVYHYFPTCIKTSMMQITLAGTLTRSQLLPAHCLFPETTTGNKISERFRLSHLNNLINDDHICHKSLYIM